MEKLRLPVSQGRLRGRDIMEWMLLPLKRYAQFSGRSRRKEYWMFVLFQILVYIAFLVLLTIVGGAAVMTGGDASGVLAAGGVAVVLLALYGIFSLAMIIPSIAVAVRRLHDTNRTGWWFLAPFLPYALVLIAIGMMAGSPDTLAAAGIVAGIGGLIAFALAITLLVFMLLDGTPGPNKYGPSPKEPLNSEVFA